MAKCNNYYKEQESQYITIKKYLLNKTVNLFQANVPLMEKNQEDSFYWQHMLKILVDE